MSEKVLNKQEASSCETFLSDEEKVNLVKPRIAEVEGVEQIFKALGDASRLRIAYALTLEEELCVCDIANILDCSTATASHHLRSLREKGIAKSRKEGKVVFYSLDDHHVRQLVEISMAHAKEGDPHGNS
ncbi:ArsR/SmtB family transcription factor [Virgibacillus xinjiangensis]|uniref:ArsR/SmtB family transcription factor n=1 Tax=Virgibacillus xinjiangensis TaxID=393090 RepID=A0ABV7CR30_9BACI